MNLKNNYFLKKLLKQTNKKQKNFNIYNVASFLKKLRKTTGDIIISHLCTKNLDMFLRCRAWCIELVIVGHFSPFYPPKNPKNQNFEKNKIAGDIIILHMCTKNYNLWCMVPEIESETHRIFCHFGEFFALLPPTTQKIKILKNWKKMPGNIIILHMCTVNNDHMMYGFWDMECNGQNLFVILGLLCS